MLNEPIIYNNILNIVEEYRISLVRINQKIKVNEKFIKIMKKSFEFVNMKHENINQK